MKITDKSNNKQTTFSDVRKGQVFKVLSIYENFKVLSIYEKTSVIYEKTSVMDVKMIGHIKHINSVHLDSGNLMFIPDDAVVEILDNAELVIN